MKKLILLLTFITLNARAAYINWDVYDYSFTGTTENTAPCELFRTTAEQFVAGPPPLPFHTERTQYKEFPCQYAGSLLESITQWYGTLMTQANNFVFLDGNMISATGLGPALDYQPRRITEMASYSHLSLSGAAGLNSRAAHGRTRFWINATSNAVHECEVTFAGGYWDNWFPGSTQPGDADFASTPALKPFNYSADGVRIGGVLCNVQGKVTIYWNPVTQGTMDLTPTVQNPTKSRHWKYGLTLRIVRILP